MAEIEFVYNGVSTMIQCNQDDKFSAILEKLSTKIKIELNSVYFLYSGELIQNQEKTFTQLANSIDKERKKMNIQINDLEKKGTVESQKIKSKQIICPECHENCLMSVIDYKIRLFDCINEHDIDGIALEVFENTQMIDESKIVCDICQNVNKINTYNKLFYRYNSCEKNICPLCEQKHDNNHNIINYEDKGFICSKHNYQYSLYCKSCKINLCVSCEMEHNSHDIISLGKMIQNKSQLLKKLEEYKNIKDKFIEGLSNIMKQLEIIKNNIQKIFEISKDIFSNDQKCINYELLHNLNESNLDYCFQYLNKINYDKDINNKFNNIIDIYNKIIKEDDEMRIIYNIDRTKNKVRIFNENFVEYNNDKYKIIYDKKEYKLNEYFETKKIKMTQKINLKLN